MLKILIVVPRSPFPANDGALLVINERIKKLKELGFHVTCFVLKQQEIKNDISFDTEVYPDKIIFSSYFNPKKNILQVIFDYFSRMLPPLVSYYFSDSISKELKSLIHNNKFNYLIFEHLHLSEYGKILCNEFPSIPNYLFHHNIESDLYFSFFKNSSLFKKPYFLINFLLTRNYEKRIYKYFNTNIFISQNDMIKAKKLSNEIFNCVHLMPSVNIDKYNFKLFNKSEQTIQIGFLASMDYKPNIEGAIWFMKNVLPKLESSNINYKFYLVGKNPNDDLLLLKNKNTIITGWVESDVDFYHKMDLIICPIFSGAGIKIKVLNALSCGKVVIATSKAVEGISGLNHNKHFLKANSSNSFFDFILKYYNDDLLLDPNQISLNARNFMINYNNNSFNNFQGLFK